MVIVRFNSEEQRTTAEEIQRKSTVYAWVQLSAGPLRLVG